MAVDRQLQTDAELELGKLEVRHADWPIYAGHPNPYVRAFALQRPLVTAETVTDATLLRVAQLLGDGSPIYSKQCAELLAGCQRGQGIDMARGLCVKQARTVGAFADEVLGRVSAERAVRAIVDYFADPGLAEILDNVASPEVGHAAKRLQTAAASAPSALTESVARRLPSASAVARKRLLEAALLAPLGTVDQAIVRAVEPLMQAKDRLEAMLACAVLVRLTDTDGSEGREFTLAKTRQAALAALEQDLPSGNIDRLLVRMGPAASPLLDSLLARVKRALDEPSYAYRAASDAQTIGAIGARAVRASPTLLEIGSHLERSQDASTDSALSAILGALGAIRAPAAQLTPFALRHATSRKLFAAAAEALASSQTKLAPHELAELRRLKDVHCTIPRHPRAFDGSWDMCFAAERHLAELEGLATGEAGASERPKSSGD